MRNLTTTIAAYGERAAAAPHWASFESAASAGSVVLADAALVGPDAQRAACYPGPGKRA